MIVVAELGFGDGGHVPFNAGLLAIVRAAYPFEDVCFAGTREHISELKIQMGEVLMKSIEWKEIALMPPDMPYFQHLIRERKTLKILLDIISHKASGLLLLANAKAATLVALKLLKCLRYREVKVQFVLHGQLGGVIGRRHRHPIRRFQEMKTALTFLGNASIQYIVLEKNLQTVLLKNLPALEKKVEVLPHPLPPNEAQSVSGKFEWPIRFGFLGLANQQKGFPTFVRLAQAIMKQCGDQAEFHAIGRVPSNESMVLDLEALATKPGITRLSRQDYVNGIDQLHFILFPYEASYYELNSSGALLDALAWAKPLIARRIPLFEDMFLKNGDIGYMFRTEEELLSIVTQVVKEIDIRKYRQQSLNIEKAQNSRTPQMLSTDYQDICQKIGYRPSIAENT